MEPWSSAVATSLNVGFTAEARGKLCATAGGARAATGNLFAYLSGRSAQAEVPLRVPF